MQRRSSAVRRQTTPSPATTSSIFDVPQPDILVVLVSGAHNDDPSTTTSGNDANFRQLEELVASMRGRLTAVQIRADRDTVREEELKAAYALFVQIGGQCRALCHALVADGHHKRPASTASSTGIDGAGIGLKGHVRRMTSAGGGNFKLEVGQGDEELDGSGNVTPRAQAPLKSVNKSVNSAWVGAVREWRACLDELAAAHKLCLTNTYKRHEQFATPEILDALFADRKSRAQVVSGWMKNFGAYKRMQGQSGVVSLSLIGVHLPDE